MANYHNPSETLEANEKSSKLVEVESKTDETYF